MRPLAIPLAILGLTGAQATAQNVRTAVPAKVTLLSEVRDSVCDEVSIAPGERLLACATTKPDFRIIDLSTKKSTILFKGMFAEDLFWSRAGDHIAFTGYEQGSRELQIWTVGIDPRTGQQTMAPRRVSTGFGFAPAYSPDAQSIAYVQGEPSNNRRLIVVPSNGGAERVVADGSIYGPVAWSADGRWIYFPKHTHTPGDSVFSVLRVPATGGASETVVEYQTFDGRGSDVYHGLSRDGRFLSVGTRPLDGKQLKALLDNRGKVLGTVALQTDLQNGTSSDYDWMPTGAKMLLTTSSRSTVLRALNMENGSARDLVSVAERPRNPSWSSDGKRLAVQLWNGSRFDMAIMNSDGSGKRLLHTASEPFDNVVVDYWSPDGRYIAYVGSRLQSIHVIDLETGKDTRLVNSARRIVNVRWSRDAKSLRFVAADFQSNATKSSLRVVGLNGQERAVRELGAGAAAYLFVNDDWVLKVVDGVLIPFGPGDTRLIHDPTNIRPKPGVSPDGRWIAFMPNGLGNTERQGIYDMVATDGPTRVVVHLPPGVRATAPLITPDGRSLIVPTVASTTEPASILTVPVNGDAPRTLTKLAPRDQLVRLTQNPDWYFDAALSPDGKTLLYLTAGPPVQHFYRVDLTPALPVTQAGKPNDQ